MAGCHWLINGWISPVIGVEPPKIFLRLILDNWIPGLPVESQLKLVSSKGMQTRVSSSPPRARSDTTDFLALRRPRAAPSDMTPAATTAAPGALTFGVALGALEEALEALVTRLT